MKPNKKVAAIAAGALAASGVAAIAAAGSASATTNSFTLYSQIKKTTLQASSYVTGPVNITMTVSPTTAAAGAPLTIVVSSSDMFMKNGPASNAAALSEEADAVVNVGGTDYVLRGSQNSQQVTYDDSELGGTVSPNRLFDAGWVISSAAGGSSSTSTNNFDSTGTPLGSPQTAAGTTGLGASVRGAEGTTGVTIPAPATLGSNTVTLKAIVVNAIAGTSTVALTDDFDNVYNKTNCAASCAANGNWATLNTNNAASYIDPFSPAVTVTVSGPSVAISQVTTDNDTYPTGQNTGNSGSVGPKVRAGDWIDLTGNSLWTPSAPVFGTVCTSAAGTGCAPAGSEATFFGGAPYTLNGGFGNSDASGNLPAIHKMIATWTSYTGTLNLFVYQTTTRPTPPGFSGANTNGPTSTGVTAKATTPIYALTTARSVAVTGAPVGVGANGNVAVTGGGFYPGETVAIGGADTTGTPTGSASSAIADSSGNISGTFQAVSGTTRAYATGHGPTGVAPIDQNPKTVLSTDGDVTVSGTQCNATPSCTTAQTLYATVTAGLLSQEITTNTAVCTGSASTGNGSASNVANIATVPSAGCNTDLTSIGFGAVSTSTAAQEMNAKINTIRVTDLRGGTTGWSLTASIGGAITNGSGGTIPANNLSLDAASTCAPVGSSAPGVVLGSSGADFGSSVLLCQKDTVGLNAGGSTSGEYDVNADLALNVPAYQPTGIYTQTLTFTLA